MSEEKVTLAKVKGLLELDESDNTRDAFLEGIIEVVEQRLVNKLEYVDKIPKSFEYIVIEVSIARFNRAGDEGMNSYSQGGQSISYDKLFAEYEEEIQNFNKKTKPTTFETEGRAWFYQ